MANINMSLIMNSQQRNSSKELQANPTFTHRRKKDHNPPRKKKLQKRKNEPAKRNKNSFQEIKTSRDDERNQFLISFPDSCVECPPIVVVARECTLQS